MILGKYRSNLLNNKEEFIINNIDLKEFSKFSDEQEVFLPDVHMNIVRSKWFRV